MHVLITADTVGGVWTYTRELVSALIRKGHRITLVSFGRLPCTTQIAWMQGLPRLDYRPTPYALEWMQDSGEDIKLSTKYVHRLIAEVRPDLLHFNQFAYGAIETSLPKIVVAHSDVVSWWIGVKREEPPATDWMKWYRETVCTGLAGADVVISPSQWMMDNVTKHYLKPVRGQLIYNGRDPALFEPSTPKKKQVLSIGRLWDAAKQVALLTKRLQEVPVLIVGSREHPDKVPSAEALESAAPGVTFCEQQSEQQICKLLAEASIYAACSCYEPFGLAPVEAALSRCALIANDIPSFHELWGDAACYFSTNDADSLAEAIGRLASDRELCQEYARRAYQHARRNFTSDPMVRMYEQLYGALAAQEAAA